MDQPGILEFCGEVVGLPLFYSRGRAGQAVARAGKRIESGPARVFAAAGSEELHWDKPEDRAVADVVCLKILTLLDKLGHNAQGGQK